TRLQELGFTRSVAERIESKSGLSREIFDAERDGTFSGVIVDSREEVLKDRADYPATYRGLHRLKPQDYKSNFDSTSFRGKVYFGDLTIATEFAKPLSDRNGIEHMILEFQVPWTVTSTAPFGDFPIFRRRQNLDERTFISRVGFYTFIPDDLTSREYFSVRPDGWRQKSELTWYDYDEVFDARGQVRKRFK
ncbi:MAG: hypothetical protein V4692_15525, partial [Bdellovibrionota bacterium]